MRIAACPVIVSVDMTDALLVVNAALKLAPKIFQLRTHPLDPFL